MSGPKARGLGELRTESTAEVPGSAQLGLRRGSVVGGLSGTPPEANQQGREGWRIKRKGKRAPLRVPPTLRGKRRL